MHGNSFFYHIFYHLIIGAWFEFEAFVFACHIFFNDVSWISLIMASLPQIVFKSLNDMSIFLVRSGSFLIEE
jgi:hypothetical protein